MVRFEVLSGKMAGTKQVARHFPFRIGRSSSASLRVEEEGVWDEHLTVAFDTSTGFVMTCQPNALTAVNGKSIEQTVLKNGDVIEIGGLRIRFWLDDTRQYSPRLREWITWAFLALITAFQVLLIYWLIR